MDEAGDRDSAGPTPEQVLTSGRLRLVLGGERLTAAVIEPAPGASVKDTQRDLARVMTLAGAFGRSEDELAAATAALADPKADRLFVCGVALRAVIDAYETLASGNSRPLKLLLGEMHNVLQGAESELFHPRGVGGRATGLVDHHTRGVSLAVLNEITSCGRSPEAAAKLVADRLWKIGKRGANGREKISAKQLLGWRRRIREQPRVTQDVYDKIQQERPAMAAQATDEVMIEGLLAMLGVVREWSC